MRIVTWIACGTWLCTFGAGVSVGTLLDHEKHIQEQSVDAQTRMEVSAGLGAEIAAATNPSKADIQAKLDGYRSANSRIARVAWYRPFHGSLRLVAESRGQDHDGQGSAQRLATPESRRRTSRVLATGWLELEVPLVSARAAEGKSDPSVLAVTWMPMVASSWIWLWLPISLLLASVAAALAHFSVGRKLQRIIDDRAVDDLDTLLEQSRSMAEDLRRLEESLDERVLVRTRELELQNKYKDEQIANTVHELRTPLTTIMASVDMLRQGYATTQEDQDMFLDQARVASQHLMFLINDILDAAAHDAGKLRIQMQNYFVNDLLEDAHKLMHPVAVFRDMTLECDVPDEIRAIYIDPGRTLQVIFNLVGNALKYAPDRSRVVLRAIYEKEDVIIEVEDEGIGIPKDSQENLFLKYRRLHSPESSSATGTGIGLYLSKVLIEEMLGTIGYRERPEGKGSIFWFRFKPHPKLAVVPPAALNPGGEASDLD